MVARQQNNRRRWLQYSLRSMLLLMIASAVGSAWLGFQAQHVKRQRAAIAQLKKAGGIRIAESKTSSLPQWLSNILVAPQLEAICICAGSNRDLVPLQELRGVREVILYQSAISDLSPISRLSSLECLSVSGSKVTDLESLADLTSLRDLDVSDTAVNDLKPLAKLTKLKSLNLCGTKVADLSPLEKLTELEELDVFDTPVSKEQQQWLSGLLPQCKMFGPDPSE